MEPISDEPWYEDTRDTNLLDDALLAMHVYNVGTNSHFRNFNQLFGADAAIGAYKLNVLFEDEAVDFGAASFVSKDRVVVSYRGTDSLLDVATGWIAGAGAGAHFSGQLVRAIAFYRATAEILGSGDIYDSGVTVVGHSLGGGLAGYIAGVYGIKADIFNFMPFEDAVIGDVQGARGEVDATGFYRDLLYGDTPIRDFDFSGVSAFVSEGDILAIARTIMMSGHDVDEKMLPVQNTGLDALDLHSMSYHTLLQYGDYVGYGFEAGSKYLVNALFSERVAETIKETTQYANTGVSASAVLKDAIAYTTVSTGAMPFGDTAAWAMLSDQYDLQMGLSSTLSSSLLTSTAQILTDISVEYAGRLAFSGDRNSEHVDWDAPDYWPTWMGALDTISGNSFDYEGVFVDFHDKVWKFDGLVVTSALKADFLNQVAGSAVDDLNLGLANYAASYNLTPNDVYDLVKSVSIEGSPGTEAGIFYTRADDLSLVVLDNFDRTVHFSGRDDGVTPDRAVLGTAQTDTIFAGGGNDVLIGGEGDDILSGGDGHDVLVGGAGADTLFGDDGNDILIGGLGRDVLFGGHGDDDLYVDHEFLTLDGGGGKNVAYATSATAGVTFNQLGGLVLNVDKIVGSDFNDTFISDGSQTEFLGGEGNDTFILYSGDVAEGGAGADIFYLSSSLLRPGVSALDYGAERNTVTIKGLDASDTIYVDGILYTGNSVSVTAAPAVGPYGKYSTDLGYIWTYDIDTTSRFSGSYKAVNFSGNTLVADGVLEKEPEELGMHNAFDGIIYDKGVDGENLSSATIRIDVKNIRYDADGYISYYDDEGNYLPSSKSALLDIKVDKFVNGDAGVSFSWFNENYHHFSGTNWDPGFYSEPDEWSYDPTIKYASAGDANYSMFVGA